MQAVAGAEEGRRGAAALAWKSGPPPRLSPPHPWVSDTLCARRGGHNEGPRGQAADPLALPNTSVAAVTLPGC